MERPENLHLICGTGSLYTRKMVALLRYRINPSSIQSMDPVGALDALLADTGSEAAIVDSVRPPRVN
jgi:hypothetical protein